MMNTSAQQVLESFDQLPESEQQVAAEILRRVIHEDTAPLSDVAPVMNAEALFLELDRREASYLTAEEWKAAINRILDGFWGNSSEEEKRELLSAIRQKPVGVDRKIVCLRRPALKDGAECTRLSPVL